MADIYEEILNHPESWIAVAVPDGAGGWSDEAAPLWLAERDPGTGGAAPLFAKVDEEVLQRPTIAALRALLDNYHAFETEGEPDWDAPEKLAEMDQFMDAVMPTAPLQMAVAYLREQAPDQFPDEAAVRAWAKQVWFEPFVNQFAAREEDCTGFEHVFVGEVNSNAQPGDNSDDVGGYHSWIKYALDQGAGLVKYRGHDYGNTLSAAGKASRHEATVVMTWKVDGTEYLKRPGGFFVGELPEVQIALGAIGVFDSMRGQYGGSGQSGKDTDRRVALGGEAIDLILYGQTIKEGGVARPGGHLRSLYPKYRGPVGSAGGPGSGATSPQTPHNSGPLRIVQALPNPPGTDETGEWVELLNVSEHAIDLQAGTWTLRDRQGGTRDLTGNVNAGATLRVDLPRTGAGAGTMVLGNNGGWILLFEGGNRIAAVPYGPAGNGVVVEFGQG